jgi:protein-S-isoprenylcysteine O-methyltransferase Ste14
MILVGVRYWIEFGRENRRSTGKQAIPYNKFFLTLIAIGYFSIWPFWIGSIAFLSLNRYYAFFDFMTFSFSAAPFLQIVGVVIFYTGSLFFTWALGFAGKYLRPSISGIHTNEHKLVQSGPLGVVRHPYYVSYVLILVGLSLTLTTLWPLASALCVVVGMGPTAEVEEEQLAAQFGEEYRQYQQRVGRFLPRLFE